MPLFKKRHEKPDDLPPELRRLYIKQINEAVDAVKFGAFLRLRAQFAAHYVGDDELHASLAGAVVSTLFADAPVISEALYAQNHDVIEAEAYRVHLNPELAGIVGMAVREHALYWSLIAGLDPPTRGAVAELTGISDPALQMWNASEALMRYNLAADGEIEPPDQFCRRALTFAESVSSRH